MIHTMGLDSEISRRDFLKKSVIVGAGLTLAGCHSRPEIPNNLKKAQKPTFTPTSEEIILPTKTQIPQETPVKTKTLSPEIARRQYLIEKYGFAKTIPALEYHGNKYSMYGDAYNMNPGTFEKQMTWFQENEYHAVTGAELTAFLNGSIDLPGRSVILTTDSGNTSQTCIPSMIDVLQRTGMHFHSFIWTKHMDTEESIWCVNDACWNTFREAIDSGVFTIGGHTETHRDFGLVNKQEGLDELFQSKKDIENNLGIEISSLSWPFEVCPYWADGLYDMGYRYAFGGRSKPLLDCSVEKKDSLRWCLPRILPPNIGGESGRPFGENLKGIMEKWNKSSKDR